MTAADDLLRWASEMGSGSWTQWRAAALHVGLEPSNAARRFAALGHIEFDWVRDRFAAAPTALVYLPRSGGSLLLTGARTRDTIASLEEAADAYGAEPVGPVPQQDGPSTYLVPFDPGEAVELAELMGCPLVFDAAGAIAAALERVTLEDVAERAEPDDRFPRRRLDPRNGFRPHPDRDHRTGKRDAVWWVDEHRRETAWVVDGDTCWWRVPVREYAPFLAHPGGSFFEYLRPERRMKVLDHTPLPPLHARALTLASGRLPVADEFQDGRRAHTYVNVDQTLAGRILETLGASTW